MSVNPNFAKKAKQFVQDELARKNVLVNYVYDKQGKHSGVVVAVRRDDEVTVGTAVCNSKLDNFNKYVGIYIAYQRAVGGKTNNVGGDAIFRAACKVMNRAHKYWRLSPVTV